ncbi:pilus assembly PilX N-terminal domain-containing protein [uncultured Desulfobulbus sp.]|uniref:pilus assembly PilX N-terminal domain-containing protein n=1 Tax=uncultured Desulfobulbus sp. TaxID=239745 RepID=UPI0029C9092E|nr:pilus assembly PilX N-terminal domain-containing protein [uncultured Desulfobulbus sp.]
MLTRMQWMPSSRLLGNENGTAIVTALLILMLLTFVALTATDTTVNEKAMVRNEAVFEQNFAQAESAALEGLQKLASKKNDEMEALVPKRLSGTSDNKDLLTDSDSDEVADIMDVLDVNGDGVVDKNDIYTDSNGNKKFDAGEELATAQFEPSKQGTEVFRSGMMLPIAIGDSLSLTTAKSRLYRYNMFGLDEELGGKAMIKIGYKRRIDH